MQDEDRRNEERQSHFVEECMWWMILMSVSALVFSLGRLLYYLFKGG